MTPLIDFNDKGNSFEIEYVKPELNEYLDSVSICGEENTIDWNNIELEDGVSMSLNYGSDDIATCSDDNAVELSDSTKPIGATFTVPLGKSAAS